MNAIAATFPSLTSPAAGQNAEVVPGRRPTKLESLTLFRLGTHTMFAGQAVRDLTLDPERRAKAEVLAERLEELAAELRNFAGG